MRISDWSSDVCSSDLGVEHRPALFDRLVDRHGVGGIGLEGGLVDLVERRAHHEEGEEQRKPDQHLTGRGLRKAQRLPQYRQDRKSVVEGKSGSVRVELGGGRAIKKTKRRKRRRHKCT